MSFAMTTPQFKARMKTVTRRFGWWFLKPGDVLWGVVKAMGLKKGESIVRLGLIEIVSTRPEPLHDITLDECVLEGFPEMCPYDFIEMLCRHYNCQPEKVVNRIEYAYL
jgi:hypothetical protein